MRSGHVLYISKVDMVSESDAYRRGAHQHFSVILDLQVWSLSDFAACLRWRSDAQECLDRRESAELRTLLLPSLTLRDSIGGWSGTPGPADALLDAAVLSFSFSFSLILSDTFLNPSFPLARSPEGLPLPTATGVETSFAVARDRVARAAGAVCGGARPLTGCTAGVAGMLMLLKG